jgi:hypothetical protein
MSETSAPTNAASADGHSEAWQAVYEQINNNFRMLTDIRFKLLALVPTVGGIAVYVLSRMIAGAAPQTAVSSTMLPPGANFDYPMVGFLSILGFLATLGIVFYDQRNSELYGLLIDGGNKLEDMLSAPLRNNFRGRRAGRRKLIGLVPMKHDTGLALIYAPLLGAWFFPLTDVCLRWRGYAQGSAMCDSLLAALLVALIFFEEFWRLNRPYGDKVKGQ